MPQLITNCHCGFVKDIPRIHKRIRCFRIDKGKNVTHKKHKITDPLKKEIKIVKIGLKQKYFFARLSRCNDQTFYEK